MYTGRNNTIQLFALPLTGAGVASPRSRLRATRDLSDLGGGGRIAGTVKNTGTPDFPVWRRVRLFLRRDGRLVREVWSDPVTGAYGFDYLNPAYSYTVIAHDHTGQYNAEISDDITPEPMS